MSMSHYRKWILKYKVALYVNSSLSNEHWNTSSDFRAVCTLTQNKTCLKVKKKKINDAERNGTHNL